MFKAPRGIQTTIPLCAVRGVADADFRLVRRKLCIAVGFVGVLLGGAWGRCI
ncbi:hypothetical protein BDW02DRAFT_572807 [Decorospora gaudefroyi]|uniref:Uncharacterized protein n=1 Tax=Decorospora gaudefroyi TaxID=184978 RepID=A0A6A5K862_9PLEO|nr:hypothetical protein BDW02DRAFT_572807 [Decorospora gaudefroyi]